MIPETGTTGGAVRPGLFSHTLDHGNPNFARALRDGDLRRTVAHEAHHGMRMAGPGYGRTLGEALVSEGLAGRFVGRLFDSPPEPWECAVTDAELAANLPDDATLAGAGHDHRAWFFGAGRYPRWLGYTLGYRIVGDWLEAGADTGGGAWVDIPAPDVIAAARGRTLPNLRPPARAASQPRGGMAKPVDDGGFRHRRMLVRTAGTGRDQPVRSATGSDGKRPLAFSPEADVRSRTRPRP
ncbi:DUF2268 domain-containing putative Zn-dependent protease [Methylobacterium sp. J-092]|uniref:DUF2268 domain-containing putative Zn-dependent protease n=1 Tax=Methylobacterium sp. J-092 TaxID=2836667 RepID=UPI0028C3E806|nr:DUF2268 domain-containing putative Zn-dependent protease [Methylobacterium sp. J-092]